MSRIQGRLRECAESCMKLGFKDKEEKNKKPRLPKLNPQNYSRNFESGKGFEMLQCTLHGS
jgi:hypothetical protein